jgi:hypothetical protein
MMKNRRKRILFYSILFVSIYIVVSLLTNGFKITTTTETIKNIDYILIDRNYHKPENYNMFMKDYTVTVENDFNSVLINFNFEVNHFVIESEKNNTDQGVEYVMLSYSFENNFYTLYYFKVKNNVSINRMYLYQPEKSAEIILMNSDFEEDFCAATDKEKYLLFKNCYDIFEGQLREVDLTVDDLLEWNATLN